jgi:hypothetical protein
VTRLSVANHPGTLLAVALEAVGHPLDWMTLVDIVLDDLFGAIATQRVYHRNIWTRMLLSRMDHRLNAGSDVEFFVVGQDEDREHI